MEVVLKEEVFKGCNLVGFINKDLVLDFPLENRAYKIPKNVVKSLREMLND
jgi:hypothetical protein